MPAGNASGEGLGRFCRKHLEHCRRHGDPLKGSYKAAQLLPHRRALAAWVKQNPDDHWLLKALQRIEGRIRGAGRAIEVRNLRGQPATEKARSVWARLRDRDVPPMDILTTILAVAMCHEADYQKGKEEYRQVQIAKALSRMAGGTVKRWPTHYTDPRLPKEKVLRWFPASEGLVLRELGEQAETIAEFFIPDRIAELVRFGAKRRADRAMARLPKIMKQLSDAG